MHTPLKATSCSIANFGFWCQTHSLQNIVQQQSVNAFRVYSADNDCTINFFRNYRRHKIACTKCSSKKQKRLHMHNVAYRAKTTQIIIKKVFTVLFDVHWNETYNELIDGKTKQKTHGMIRCPIQHATCLKDTSCFDCCNMNLLKTCWMWLQVWLLVQGIVPRASCFNTASHQAQKQLHVYAIGMWTDITPISPMSIKKAQQSFLFCQKN